MMARLIGESGPAASAVLSLEEGEEWIIGRDPDEATVVIEDPHASRQHLLCRRTPEGIEVENLSETNPALLNSEPFEGTRLLAEGDRLQIGETVVRFTLEEEAAAIAVPPEEEEEEPYETIFEAPEVAAGPVVHLEPRERWLVKVVAGPNTGAEVRLAPGRSYLLGTDAGTCDIVFHDLSVSRHHARLHVSAEDEVSIEDLGSRNGVVIEGRLIEEREPIAANAVVALGTTSILLIDREGAQETVVAPAAPLEGEAVPAAAEAAVAVPRKPILSGGPFVLLLTAGVIVVIVLASLITLFTGREAAPPPRDFETPIHTATQTFPDVRFSFNPANGRLFLLGHVLTPVDKSELLYNIDKLEFVTSIDDNVVIDQYVWEETNAIISKNSQWTGVSMYAPKAGRFVLTGYLKNSKQAASLQDYIHLHFTYLDRLENQVVVEEILLAKIQATLQSNGFASVTPGLTNGDVTLSGYVARNESAKFQRIIGEIKKLRGVRTVKNLTVIISEECSLVDLTGRYEVQGYSRHDGVTVNVLVDGQILSRGDYFQGMRVISLTSHSVILEKEGIKYKIDYGHS